MKNIKKQKSSVYSRVVMLMTLLILSWCSSDSYGILTNYYGEKIVEVPMFTILNLMTLNYLRKNLKRKFDELRDMP